jgi:hypothetical protein
MLLHVVWWTASSNLTLLMHSHPHANTYTPTHTPDIPKVDWIIQFDPPDEPKEYIHRVGRTARGTNTQGRALLLLLPQELQFLKYLRHANVELTEFEFPQNKIANIQTQVASTLFSSCIFFVHVCREPYKVLCLSARVHMCTKCYRERSIFITHRLKQSTIIHDI